MRLFIPKLVVALVFLALIGRLYQLQLVETQSDKYVTTVNTTRYVPIRPFRGEIYASDAKTLLAESSPVYTVAIRVSDLPAEGTSARFYVFAELSQVLGITNTLTISPALTLEKNSALREGVAKKLADVP